MSLITVIKTPRQNAPVNLYNTNGTLTGNRTVTGGGFSLTFTGQSNYSIVSPSASALDTAWSIRNNTDTSNLIRVDGEGKIGINANPFAFSRLYVNANAGQYAGYFDASDEIAVFASSVGNRGVYALSTNLYAVQGISTNSYGGVFSSSGNYALWAQATGANTLGALINGTVKTVSPSASSLDTAWSVRNNTDTADMLRVNGAGAVRADGGFTSTGINYFETIKNPFFVSSGIEIFSGLIYNSRGEIGSAYTQHDFKTENLVTTPGSYLMRVRNFNTLHFAIDKDGQIEMPSVQVGNAGLVSGDLYFDTAANILANGDLVCGRKV